MLKKKKKKRKKRETSFSVETEDYKRQGTNTIAADLIPVKAAFVAFKPDCIRSWRELAGLVVAGSIMSL